MFTSDSRKRLVLHPESNRYLHRPMLLSIVLLLGSAFPTMGQISLTGTSHSINFNDLGSGLPTGVQVYTNASISSLGTAASAPAQYSWADADGAFKNLASTNGLSSASTPANQNASSDRALGVRTTGSFGDTGAAFVITIEDTLGFENFSVALDLLMLYVNGRSHTWTFDYRVGDTGNFTSLGTWPDPGVWGGTTFTANLGSIANDQASPVYIRVVALTASTGSGSRDTVAVDNFVLTYQLAEPVPDAPVLLPASATNVSSFTAAWQEVVGTTGYRLDVATRDEFLPAGSTLITNDFEGGFPPAGWTTNEADQSSAQERSGSYSVRLNAADDYLITPLIDRPAELRVWSYRTSEPPTLIAEQSTSTNGPWTAVSGSPFSGATQQWNECSAVLSNSAAVYVRFQKAGSSGSVYLDDVHIVSAQSDFVPGYDDRTVTDGSAVSASVTGLVSSTAYFYRVRAAGNTTVSGNSTTQSVTTLVMPAPVVQAATAINYSTFDANWSAVTEATGYYLDVSTNNAFAVYQPGYSNRVVNGISTTTVTGLLASLTYHYRVRAYDAGSTSANSATQSVTTPIKPEPTSHATGLGAATLTHRTIILNWTDASGGTLPDGYLVRGSTNGFADIPTPTDTVNVPNTITNWSTGYANKIAQGVQADELRGLAAQRTYYFKLFPYANQFSAIDYKTDGSVPAFSVTTGVAPLEDFEVNWTQLSYTTNTLTFSSGGWLFNNAMLGQTASDERRDQKAARIQGNGLIEMQFNAPDVETFSLEFANFGTDTSGTFVVEKSTDDGVNWSQLNSEVTCGDDLQTASTTIHHRGPMRFRIRMTGGTRINIDNVRVTPFRLRPSVFRFN